MNENTAVLRWGIVGTGMITNKMAPMMKQARFADPARRGAWITATERTQEFLDAAWNAANRQGCDRT